MKLREWIETGEDMIRAVAAAGPSAGGARNTYRIQDWHREQKQSGWILLGQKLKSSRPSQRYDYKDPNEHVPVYEKSVTARKN